MLQGFYWDGYADSNWTTLEDQADEMSQYFSLIWVPNSAYANDVEWPAAFAQLVNALGHAGDVFMGITTSGNSGNIVDALMVARAKGVKTIALTGRDGGRCKALADVCIIVPEKETFKIQERHLPIYHALCAMVEATLFEPRSC
jgi:D-sedoheptulose 7-phosphate isomerase